MFLNDDLLSRFKLRQNTVNYLPAFHVTKEEKSIIVCAILHFIPV